MSTLQQVLKLQCITRGVARRETHPGRRARTIAYNRAASMAKFLPDKQDTKDPATRRCGLRIISPKCGRHKSARPPAIILGIHTVSPSQVPWLPDQTHDEKAPNPLVNLQALGPQYHSMKILADRCSTDQHNHPITTGKKHSQCSGDRQE